MLCIHLLFCCLSPSTFQLECEFCKVRDEDVLFTDRSSEGKLSLTRSNHQEVFGGISNEGGFPWWLRQERIHLQCRRTGFNPCVEKIPWRREWQPTPVFLLREVHGQRNLVGYSPWDHKESDTTERLFFLLWMRRVTEGLGQSLECVRDSLVAQTVKSLPAMWETWVRSLGGEDPLEKKMATHSSVLAWKIP